MENNVMTNKLKYIENMSSIPRIAYRCFEGESDYPKILKIVHGCRIVDGLERADTLDDISNIYSHLFNCDPHKDMLFAEVNGEVVAYTRVHWALEGSGDWIGFQNGYVLPEWRRQGIGSSLMQFNEGRLRQTATELIDSGQIPVDTRCMLDNYASSSETDRIALLEKRGYQAVRYSFDMVRPDLENIPDLPLPAGVEVRPVEPWHFRLIWEAANEAFRDHWGYIPDPWEEFERFRDDADFDPSLFRIAWHGDQVVGMVINFIEKDENELYHRKRGYTENICVLRPWRRQGLAKALIARSLLALKERGMTSACLGVDAENTSGALNLYKSIGYQVVKQGTIYRKLLSR